MKTETTSADSMASLCANSANLIMTGSLADMLARGLQPYQKRYRLLGPGGSYRALHTQVARLEKLAEEMTSTAKALVEQCSSSRIETFDLISALLGRTVDVEATLYLHAKAEAFSRAVKRVAQIFRNRFKYRRVGIDKPVSAPKALDAVRPSRRNLEDLVEAFAALQDACIRFVGPVKYVTQRCYDCVADKECGLPKDVILEVFRRYLHVDIDLGGDDA